MSGSEGEHNNVLCVIITIIDRWRREIERMSGSEGEHNTVLCVIITIIDRWRREIERMSGSEGEHNNVLCVIITIIDRCGGCLTTLVSQVTGLHLSAVRADTVTHIGCHHSGCGSIPTSLDPTKQATDWGRYILRKYAALRTIDECLLLLWCQANGRPHH